MGIANIKGFFRSEDAILLAAICYQTYPFFEKGKLILPKGFERRYTINAISGVAEPKQAVFGFIAESKDKIILAFRGTDTNEDLDSDLDIFQMPYPYVENTGNTHRGITNIYQSTRDNLIEELNRLSPSKKLFITGHSLGGDLAILASLDIAMNTKFKKTTLYTFAAGRVGDPTFVKCFNKEIKRSIRIYNDHDFIPTLPAAEYPAPFTEDGLIYRHVNKKYPIAFQMNNMFLNHRINCYFNTLSKEDPDFTEKLRLENPGFCPDTGTCYIHD
ncbi:MAG: lipase family protein [Clostridia bacterium]|nr:lipase family protein [Clostridia bacterium]